MVQHYCCNINITDKDIEFFKKILCKVFSVFSDNEQSGVACHGHESPRDQGEEKVKESCGGNSLVES